MRFSFTIFDVLPLNFRCLEIDILIIVPTLPFRNEYKDAQKSGELKNKIVLIIMKIILPLSFITMKLLGCFIDFMISLINSESTGNAKSIPSLNMTNLRLTAISDLNEFAIVKSKVGPYDLSRMITILNHDFGLIVRMMTWTHSKAIAG